MEFNPFRIRFGDNFGKCNYANSVSKHEIFGDRMFHLLGEYLSPAFHELKIVLERLALHNRIHFKFMKGSTISRLKNDPKNQVRRSRRKLLEKRVEFANFRGWIQGRMTTDLLTSCCTSQIICLVGHRHANTRLGDILSIILLTSLQSS